MNTLLAGWLILNTNFNRHLEELAGKCHVKIKGGEKKQRMNDYCVVQLLPYASNKRMHATAHT